MFEVSGHPKRKMEFGEISMAPIMSEMLSARVLVSKEWKSLSAKFLLLVYKDMSFWVSVFLLSSSCEKHVFFWGGGEFSWKEALQAF